MLWRSNALAKMARDCYRGIQQCYVLKAPYCAACLISSFTVDSSRFINDSDWVISVMWFMANWKQKLANLYQSTSQTGACNMTQPWTWKGFNIIVTWQSHHLTVMWHATRVAQVCNKYAMHLHRHVTWLHNCHVAVTWPCNCHVTVTWPCNYHVTVTRPHNSHVTAIGPHNCHVAVTWSCNRHVTVTQPHTSHVNSHLAIVMWLSHDVATVMWLSHNLTPVMSTVTSQ